MLNNLSGWHAVIILAVLLVMAAAAVGVVLLALFLARRARRNGSPLPTGSDARAASLAELAELGERGLLSPEELTAKRAEILREV
jgi:cytochrome c-type biogenesis protein CcmH/NrfG